MRKLRVVLLLSLAGIAHAQTSAPPVVDAALLGFEREPLVGKSGWYGGPPDTLLTDSAEKHGGSHSLRLERTVANASGFSFVAVNVPIDFAGEQIELRGWLRRDGEGVPSLWMRQDGNGQALAFVDMSRAPAVSNDWGQHSISFRLLPAARTLVIGVRLVGVGKAWADDLELLVDGKPYAERVRAERPPSPLDTDKQFDGGSGIALDAITSTQIDTLVLTGKVWGFLKYHHPVVTAGKLHWDYELLRKLPTLLAAPDVVAAQKVLVAWVDSLGEVPACNPCATAPAPGWLADRRLLGAELSARLQSVSRNRAPGQQFYVGLAEGAGNPEFVNEAGYPALHYPDSGFQVLAIYRFWNVFEYWSPYRNLVDEDWDEVLRDTLRRAARGLDPEAFQRELMALVARADDGHANLWSAIRLREPAGSCQLPVNLRYIEKRFVVAALAPLDDAKMFHVGDVLLSLDGVPVADIVGRVRRYYGASNETARMRDIAHALTRGACGAVKVGLQRQRAMTFAAQRVELEPSQLNAMFWNDRPGETFQMLSPELAYLKLSSIKAADAPGYIEKARDARALLVDIRNYPGEFVVFALGQLLVDEPRQFVRFSRPDLSAPGVFTIGDGPVLQPSPPQFAGRVLILVDETTQSQAEYTTMALRAGARAIVVGSQTAGADGNMSQLTLPGGYRAGLSGLGVFYPDQKPTQRVGVAIDVPCRSTAAGIRAGRDEILECARKALASSR